MKMATRDRLALEYFNECKERYENKHTDIPIDNSTWEQLRRKHYGNKTSGQDRTIREKLDFLQKNEFCILLDIENHAHFLDKVFRLIDLEWENPSPKIARLTKEGFSFYDGPSLRTVTYVSHFDEDSLSSIGSFLMYSGIKLLLEKYYMSNIGVCNVRAYRYTRDPNPKNTHISETFDETEVHNPHKDNLLPGTIKIMLYKNPIGDNLDLKDGMTELQINGAWIAPSGKSPLCLIFNSNDIKHRAQLPDPGRVRDVIEITVIPKIEDDFPIISSGAHAGYPENLRTHWSKA